MEENRFDAVAFGRRVAAARVWKGLEPKELAHRLGMSDEAIYRLERGARKQPPHTLMLRALAEELDQSEEWLLRGEQPPWSEQSYRPGGDEILAALNGLKRDLMERIDELERRLRERPR